MKLPHMRLSKEVKITLAIWAILLVLAIAGLFIMRAYTSRILENIYYVNVSRNAKSQVLYAEAESEARKTLEHAEELNRKSSTKVIVPANYPHYQRAVTLYDQALQYDQFPEFYPDRTAAYELYAQILDAAGNREQQLLMNARAFRSRKNTADAWEYVNKALEIAPESIEPYALAAQFDIDDNLTTRAEARLVSVATTIPLNARAHWVLGTAMSANGSLTSATSEFEQAVAAAPKNLDYRLALGRAYIAAEEKDKALATLSKGMELGGDMDPVFLHVYGEYLVKTGNYSDAVTILSQADRLAPFSGDIQMSLARAYSKAGKTRQADSALRRAMQIKPELQDRIF